MTVDDFKRLVANLEAARLAQVATAKAIDAELKGGIAPCQEVRDYNDGAARLFYTLESLLSVLRQVGALNLPNMPPSPVLFRWRSNSEFNRFAFSCTNLPIKYLDYTYVEAVSDGLAPGGDALSKMATETIVEVPPGNNTFVKLIAPPTMEPTTGKNYWTPGDVYSPIFTLPRADEAIAGLGAVPVVALVILGVTVVLSYTAIDLAAQHAAIQKAQAETIKFEMQLRQWTAEARIELVHKCMDKIQGPLTAVAVTQCANAAQTTIDSVPKDMSKLGEPKFGGFFDSLFNKVALAGGALAALGVGWWLFKRSSDKK